jgi:hypothetical protein
MKLVKWLAIVIQKILLEPLRTSMERVLKNIEIKETIDTDAFER